MDEVGDRVYGRVLVEIINVNPKRKIVLSLNSQLLWTDSILYCLLPEIRRHFKENKTIFKPKLCLQ